MTAWFQPSDPPPFDLKVLGRRGRSQFPCVRILHRQRRCPVWGRLRGPRIQWLREPPEAWRPLDPSYAHPKPSRPPAAFLERMAALDAKPQAIETAVEARAWWLDAGAVTYSPAGAITPREAEGRVMRALNTARTTKLERPGGPGLNADWIAKMVTKVEIETGIRERATYWHDNFQPTPRDISDCPTAVGWVAPLKAYQSAWYEVVNYRSGSYSWGAISGSLSATVADVMQHYERALRLVTYHANEVALRGWNAA